MLNSIIVGILLTFTTVGIHAAGTTWWISYLRDHEATLRSQRNGWLLQNQLLGSTAVVLLLLHVLEVVVWACAFRILRLSDIQSFEEATYFSAVTFSSLGYGDVVVTGPWRMLAALESMVGLLIFGWSTALLFALVQRIWQQRSANQSQ